MSTRLHTVSRNFAPIAFAVAMLAPTAAQAQNTCTVDSLADDSGSTTLRARIADSSCPNINFSVQGTITLSEPLGISRDLTITGPGPNLLTVRRSDSGGTTYFPIFGIFEETLPPTVTINGLTITNGSAANGGEGGGIVIVSGTLTLTNSIVSGNTASYGGGIVNGGTLTLINSTVSGNSARYYSVGGDDHAGGAAGGILDSGTLTLVNSTVSGNTADAVVGGIFSPGAVTLVNSTISGNGSGGIAAVTLTLTNSTVSGNGFGIYYATANIKNSLVANNVDGNCSASQEPGQGITNTAGVNFDTDGTCAGFTQVTSEVLNLGPLATNGGPTQTHALLAGSVAIDAVTDCTDWESHPVATDQRGIARPQGHACDAGAYELIPPHPVFSGFFAPVANPPTVNFVKAGQGIAVKFSLGGNWGTNVLATGYPKSQQVTCGLAASTSTITETVTATAGNSGLTYDSATQTYTYVWKTEKSWANTCRRLTIVFSDDSLGTKTAEFALTK